MENRKGSALVRFLYLVMLFAAAAVLAFGIHLHRAYGELAILAAGIVSVIAVIMVWLLAVSLRSSRSDGSVRLDAQLVPIHDRLDAIATTLQRIAEQQLISERAKAIAFRDRERDALRRAIGEETARRDFDAALVLVNEIEAVFGYKQEADRIRQEILSQRDADVQKQVDDGLAAIDRLCRGEQWTQASREADRLMKLFPQNEQAQRLPQDIEQRRQDLKRQLIGSWNEAVSRHDVDGSIEILKQLDLYLTPSEAEAMQETARQVFKDKLMLLGQQFATAMKDRHWPQAIRLGETIIGEFPNSRMAQEVREKLELLRQKAAEGQPAGA